MRSFSSSVPPPSPLAQNFSVAGMTEGSSPRSSSCARQRTLSYMRFSSRRRDSILAPIGFPEICRAGRVHNPWQTPDLALQIFTSNIVGHGRVAKELQRSRSD